MSAAAPAPALVIGSRIRVATKFGEAYEGELFAFDAKSATVILVEALAHTTAKVNRRVIKTAFIVDVKVLKRSSGNPIGDLPGLPAHLGVQREKAAIAASERAWPKQNQGRGVSDQAQALMDLLGRQYKCEWKGQDIFVRDIGIMIKAPYRTQTVYAQGAHANAQAMDQVKKAVRQIAAKFPYSGRGGGGGGGHNGGGGHGGRSGGGGGGRNGSRSHGGSRGGGSRGSGGSRGGGGGGGSRGRSRAGSGSRGGGNRR